MADIDTLIDYDRLNPTAISREEYTDVGSSEFAVGTYPRAFKNMEVWTAATGGTQLTLDTDYDLPTQDLQLSSTDYEGDAVYSGIRILNATYQTGSIYLTYDAVGTYPNSDLLDWSGYPDAGSLSGLEEVPGIQNGDRVKITINDIVGLAPSLTVPRDYITGYDITIDDDENLTIASGSCANSTNSVYITDSAGAIDITTTGAGGLDTGSIAASTRYYIFKAASSDLATFTEFASASQSSPTIPSGYTYYRNIGDILTDSSSDFLAESVRYYHKAYQNVIYDTEVSATGTYSLITGFEFPDYDQIIVTCGTSDGLATADQIVNVKFFLNTTSSYSIFFHAATSTVTRYLYVYYASDTSYTIDSRVSFNVVRIYGIKL